MSNEITFWQFIGLVSLLVAVFGSYFSEGNRIAVFYVLFTGILVYAGYKVYSSNKEIFTKIQSVEKGKKNPHITLAIPFVIEALFVASLGLFVYYIIEIMITLPKNDFSIISVLFMCGLWLLLKSTRVNYVKKEPYKYNLGLIICLSVLYGISCFFGTLVNSPNILIHAISYLSVFKSLLLFFVMMGGFSLIFQLMYNKGIYKKFDFKKNTKFDWKKSFGAFFSITFVFAMLVFVIFVPQIDRPENITEDQCTITKTYQLSSEHNMFGVYKRSIFIKGVSEIEFTFEGILQKDGEYLTIDLLNKSLDKSYLQYFETEVVKDDQFNYLLFLFRDRNIEYLDNLKITTTIRKC